MLIEVAMSRMRNFITKMILPVMIILIIVTMSIIAYNSIMDSAEKRCKINLENNAATINNEIIVRFKDNITIFKLAADAMVQENRVESYEAITKHINAFQSMTIFDRIDILYPDNTILLQTGERKIADNQISFAKISGKGEHISERTTDILNGQEVICYIVPVVSQGKTVVAFIGVINCNNMPNLFKTRAYDGNAFNCIIDVCDGSFILDDWHKQLGNMYEMKQRKTLKGYENIDLISDVKNSKTGVVAYKSAVTGENSFMYYTPVGIFNWELLIVVQEDVAFASQLQLKQTLIFIGSIEALLLILYFVWTFFTVSQLEKSRNEIEKRRHEFEMLSYKDTLTSLYNRNKYNQVIEKFQNLNPKNMGVAFFDLNGLKQVNDEQGHKAGDIFIQNAAKNIASIFSNKAFRIGGDEFVILYPEIDENLFEEKIQSVKKALKQNNVCISVGYAWKNGEYILSELMKEADKKMYEDKKNYYENRTENRDRRCKNYF